MPEDSLPSPLQRVDKTDQIRHSLESGETLFLQGDPAAGLYYLVSGTIDLTRTTSSGHSLVIHRARCGETFAEASIFSATYHCTATAKGKSQLVECRRSAIASLFETDIDFAYKMASRFAQQIQNERRRRELLSIKSADERVLVAISDGLLVEDIASFADGIGLAPETVYRALSRLNKNGQIKKTARGSFLLAG